MTGLHVVIIAVDVVAKIVWNFFVPGVSQVAIFEFVNKPFGCSSKTKTFYVLWYD